MTRHGVDLDRAPTLIRKVEVDTAFTLGEPDVDRSQGPIELGTSFKEIKG